MNTTKNIATYLGISLACLMLVSQAAYAEVAGYAQFVNGSVQIVSVAGQTRTLQKGEAVNEGDTVISAKAASAQIKMQDGGFVAILHLDLRTGSLRRNHRIAFIDRFTLLQGARLSRYADNLNAAINELGVPGDLRVGRLTHQHQASQGNT